MGGFLTGIGHAAKALVPMAKTYAEAAYKDHKDKVQEKKQAAKSSSTEKARYMKLAAAARQASAKAKSEKNFATAHDHKLEAEKYEQLAKQVK